MGVGQEGGYAGGIEEERRGIEDYRMDGVCGCGRGFVLSGWGSHGLMNLYNTRERGSGGLCSGRSSCADGDEFRKRCDYSKCWFEFKKSLSIRRRSRLSEKGSEDEIALDATG